MSEAGSILDTSGWRFRLLPKRSVGRDLVSVAGTTPIQMPAYSSSGSLLQSSAPRYMVGSGSFSARDDPQPGVTRARYIGFPHLGQRGVSGGSGSTAVGSPRGFRRRERWIFS